MNDIVSLAEVRAARAADPVTIAANAVRESHRALAAALSPLLPLPPTPACAKGHCEACPGVKDGIICGHDCGHGFEVAS